MEDFGLKIEDECKILPSIVYEQSEGCVELYQWQRNAIEYFFQRDKAIFEVTSGCLRSTVRIEIPRNLGIYPDGVPIKELVGKKNFWIYSFNVQSQQLELKKARRVWLNKKNVKLYEITTLSGKKIQATANHPFLVDIKEKPKKRCGRGTRERIINRKYKKLEDLKEGDYVTTFNRSKHRRNDGEYIKVDYTNKKRVLEHRFIIEQIKGKINIGNNIHHINENKFDNCESNLQELNHAELSHYRIKKRGSYQKELLQKEIKNRTIQYSEKIINIKYIGNEDAYDIEVEGNHNFIANGVVVHNSGKTFCSIQIIKELIKREPNIKILIIVPKNVILETTWFKELYENGISLTEIGVYYGAIKEFGKITITNMQNIQYIPFEIFDCAIFDEIHNYGTKRLLPYIKYPFKYKVGLSATVERSDNAHWEILKIFDYNVFKYTPKQALNDDILNPFNFTNIGVIMDDNTYSKYDSLTQELNVIFQTGGGFKRLMLSNTGLKYRMLSKLNERKELVNNYPIKFNVINDICLKHKNDKILVFNQFNNQTNKCYWHLLDVGIKAKIIHSGVEKTKRDQILIDFKNDKFSTLLTSKVLDEGYNLPAIDTAIIAAGDSTAKQTIQRMGRVLRRKVKRSSLYQVYCKNTIEEDYARGRAELFNSLCEEYNSFIYGDNNYKKVVQCLKD